MLYSTSYFFILQYFESFSGRLQHLVVERSPGGSWLPAITILTDLGIHATLLCTKTIYYLNLIIAQLLRGWGCQPLLCTSLISLLCAGLGSSVTMGWFVSLNSPRSLRVHDRTEDSIASSCNSVTLNVLSLL